MKNYQPFGVSQNCYFIKKLSKVKWKNRMTKFPSKVKVINIKVTLLYYGLERGSFGFGRGTFAYFAKKWGPWPLWSPVPTSLFNIYMRNCKLHHNLSLE